MRYVIFCILFPFFCHAERFVVEESGYNPYTEKIQIIINDTEDKRKYFYYLEFEDLMKFHEISDYLKEPKNTIQDSIMEFIFWQVPSYSEPFESWEYQK
jgi:hypothetical protein